MNAMDYEKAYKAALETATHWFKAGCTDKVKICLECVFPELRESEDERNERIRKAIVHLLEVASEAYLIDATGFKKEQFLSYLEKQKESLHIEKMCKENADSFTDDDRIRKEIIEYLKLHDKGENDYAHTMFSEWFAWLEKQKEQKVDIDKLRRDIYQSGYNDGYRHGKEDAQKEQKLTEWSEFNRGVLEDAICATDLLGNDKSFNKDNPNLAKAFRIAKDWLKSLPERFNPRPKPEWSEEDREMLNSILLYFNAPFHDMTDVEKNMFTWLQSLPERFNLQPKQEWSEEDEHRRTDAIYFLESAKSHYADTSEVEKTILWLKSLRPHWKPSEEQMKALNEVANDGVLLDLFNDLLKLL